MVCPLCLLMYKAPVLTAPVTDLAYTGAEFSSMSDADQSEAALRASLFARVEPAHKTKLVELLQKQV